MNTVDTVCVAAVAVAFVGWYLSYTAARLHRLHTRVEGALAALDAAFVRRAEAAMEMAVGGMLDPASALLLADAARSALEVSADAFDARDWRDLCLAEREARESELTLALRRVVGEPQRTGNEHRGGIGQDVVDGVAGDLVARVFTAHDRVRLARAFYDDAVRDVRWLRSRRVVRLTRLAGHAHLPRVLVLDDRRLEPDDG